MGAMRDSVPLYERDLFEWSLHMADMLRKRNAAALDWENIAGEIESLAGRDRRELFSRIRVLLVHLLKWEMQDDHRSKGWRHTIRDQREEIALLLEQSPSLRRFLGEAVQRGYPRAVEKAVEEMGLEQNPFPGVCPYTSEQILAENFLPG